MSYQIVVFIKHSMYKHFLGGFGKTIARVFGPLAIIIFLLPTNVYAATCFSTTTPTWAFTAGTGQVTDLGVVGSVRRFNFASDGSGSYDSYIQGSATGLYSGTLYTISVSTNQTRNGSAFDSGQVQLLVNGVQLDSQGSGSNPTLTGSFTGTGSSATVKLQLHNTSLGPGVSNYNDWSNVVITATSCAAPPPTQQEFSNIFYHATTSASTTLLAIIDYPNADVFMGFMVFAWSMWFIIWLFRRN